MGFEEALATRAILSDREKTNTDKALGRDDITALRELVKKPVLERSDLLEIMYLLAATESKLYNFSAWRRNVILKFYARIREHVDLLQMVFDYNEYVVDKSKKQPGYELSARTRTLLDTCRRRLDQNCKFLIEVYLLICRSTVSIDAKGFEEAFRQTFRLMTNQNKPIEEQTKT